MALILSLETSTNICSVAVHSNENLLIASELHVEQSHASKLAILVENILSSANIKSDQLEAIAVSSGPGSYTGLRIGTSTAKGLCYALDIPLIAVNTLELMAFQMRNANYMKSLLCPMIDARRMEVYCLLTDPQLNTITPTESKIIDETSFLDVLNQQEILFFGNGAAKCQNVITHPNARFIEGIHPLAAQLGYMAFEYWKNEKFEDLLQYEPFYFKDFVAKPSRSLL